MSPSWDSQALLEPISAAQPCGLNLEDTVLAELDRMRLFGQGQSLQPGAAGPSDAQDGGREPEKVRVPPDWDEMRRSALQGLEQSKDLRLLAYLGTALLWGEGGVPAFAEVLTTASQWLDHYWAEVHPLIDEDAIARRNALNCLADPMAVVDRVWRMPLVASRKHGRFSLRDVDLAAGQATPGATESRADPAAIREAFAELPLDTLTRLAAGVSSATAALTSIDARMRSEGGPEVAPDFAPLTAHFARMHRLLQERLAARPEAGAESSAPGAAAAPGELEVGGAIRSRQDAVRALDAVAEFFRRNEPSSPVPLFVDRAKRLVSKDFLEVLADIAPDALAVARSAGGLKQDE